MVTERLARIFPDSTLTAIDGCRHPGRLYRGDRSRVRFLQVSSSELRRAETHEYQLVVIADVLHHVPRAEWPEFLRSASDMVASGGIIILKDWIREPTPPYLMGYCADRFITGDRVNFAGDHELRRVACGAFGSDSIRAEFRVPPWHCNLALVIQPTRVRGRN